MNRATPIPNVVITPTVAADSEEGCMVVNIVIDVQATPEISNGFVVLDEPEDLHILRRAIDKYIKLHNIPNTNHMNTEEDKMSAAADTESESRPRFLDVIEGVINAEWRPTRGFNPDDRHRFRILSSQDIVLQLADMVDMELNDVAEAMLFLGYRTIVYDGSVGWLLERRP